MPDLYFVNTPRARMRRDWESLERVQADGPDFAFYRPPQATLTEFTICAYDEAQPGLLAKVSGALLALNLNVHTAFLYTLPDAHTPARRMVLATFLLGETYRGRPKPLEAGTEEQTRRVLDAVLRGHTDVRDLLGRRWRPEAPLEIRALTARSEENTTLITLQARDNPGVLFRMARALATLELNIVQGQVNTFESAVDDIFYVTDAHGQPLSKRASLRIGAKLRALL